MADKRIERMLEELVQLPGNNYCADCRAPSPRWASVNLGITLCVSCASIHRKLGTHKSRVKSITLDTWTREQVTSLRSIGNKASNAIYNSDERRHPPPTSSSTSERDSEMEKFIRKKYEQGAFKAGAASSSSSRAMAEPTSRNRFREAQNLDSRGPWDRSQENRQNPELNDLVVRMEGRKKSSPQERELPPLPISANSTGTGAGARERPRPTPAVAPAGLPLPRGGSSALAPPSTLVDLGGGGTTNSTLPLQTLAPPLPSPSYLSTSAPNLSPAGQLMPGNSYFTPTAPNSTSSTPVHSPPALIQPNQTFNPFTQNQFSASQQMPAFQHSQSFGHQQPMYASPYATNPFNASPGTSNAFAAQGFSQQLGYQQLPQQQYPGSVTIPNGMNGNAWPQQQQQQPLQPMQMPMGWMGQTQPMGSHFAYAQGQ